jgi:hypothetical protein
MDCVRQVLLESGGCSLTGRSYEVATDKTVVIMWDGLNVEERECVMSWMTMSKSWVLWKKCFFVDQSSSTGENTTEEKLKLGI